MKKIFSILMAVLFAGVLFATPSTSTLTFTAACGGTGTADDEAAWTITSDGTESTYDATKGIHYGTGSAAVGYIQLSTSDIAGTITSSDDPANTKLPSRNATTAQRRAAADSCTLHDAMKWNNLESLEEKLTEMAANKEGTIYSIYDSDHTSDVVFIIFPTTTFSELYAQNQSQ